MTAAVLSTRELEKDRARFIDWLEGVRLGSSLTEQTQVEVLERAIELVELAKEEVRQRRNLQQQFDRVVSCR